MSRRCTPGLIAVAFTLAVSSAAVCHASGSQESCTAGAALRQFDLETADRSRVGRIIELPDERPLLVMASEMGIDVTLDLRVAEGQPRLSDNPFRRAGPQYLLLEDSMPGRVEIGVRGNEPGRALARVSVRSLKSAPAGCLPALRAIARGDGHYAQFQAISLGDVAAGDDGLPRSLRQSLTSYREAAAAATPDIELRDHASMSVAGVLLLGLQDWPAALEAARAAEQAQAARGNEYGALRARGMWAVALSSVALGGTRNPVTREASVRQFEESRAALRQVAAAHARRREIFDQALILNAIGLSFYNQDLFEAALREYRQARELHRSLGEHMREAQSLQNIALVQLELAHFREARADFRRALKLLDQDQSPKLYGDILNNLALMEARTANTDAAIRLYSQALGILERIHSRREQARSLHGLGSVYRVIGNRTDALRYYQRAFELRSRVADIVGYQYSLSAVADGLRDNGRIQEAIELRRQAVEDTKSGVQRGRMLVGLATDLLAAGDRAGAAAALGEVIAADAHGDKVLLARARALRSRLHLQASDLVAARADLNAALESFRHYQLVRDEFQALLISAQVHCAAAQFQPAGRDVDAALTLAESLRKTSNNPFLRAASWESTHPAFDLAIHQILSPASCGGTPLEARLQAMKSLELAELARARTLADLRAVAGKAANGKADDARERRRRELFEQLADRRQRLESAIEGGRQDSARSETLRAEVSRLLREIDMLDAENGVAAPPPPAKRLAERLEMIPADTAVVEYWLGETKAYAWVVDKSGVQVVDLGSSQRINEVARQLADAMQKFASTPPETRIAHSRELHRLVIAPLGARLRGIGTLHVVPDGMLHQVAFAALVTNEAPARPAFLIDSHDIAVAPSVIDAFETVAPAKLSRDALTLVVADPVYEARDARLVPRDSVVAGRAPAPSSLRAPVTGNLPRLAGSGREAERIAKSFHPGKAEMLIGFMATREALLERDLSRYRVIHLAVHAIADVEAPQLSNVVLSTLDRDGRPIVGEVFAGDLLSRRLNAALVVLSGCDTSLGRHFIGEGLSGMRYAAHAAGARTVVASLWKVADVVGPELMSTFYDRMLQSGATPAAALAQAMKETRKHREDPALWAVFQVSTAASAPTVH